MFLKFSIFRTFLKILKNLGQQNMKIWLVFKNFRIKNSIAGLKKLFLAADNKPRDIFSMFSSFLDPESFDIF